VPTPLLVTSMVPDADVTGDITVTDDSKLDRLGVNVGTSEGPARAFKDFPGPPEGEGEPSSLYKY
jgi:hypothetical protein